MKKIFLLILLFLYLVPISIWSQDLTEEETNLFKEALVGAKQANAAYFCFMRHN